MKALEACHLCEWGCRVNRIKGETGVCGLGLPRVGVSMLHPAPPASFDAFLVGCNFRCLGCQNYTLSMHRERGEYIPPEEWAEMGLHALQSLEAKRMGADRLFFTGGEPTCSLPWVEAVVEYAQTKVNFDTNGFLTEDSLERVISFSDSITFDIKAFSDKAHKLLTGAPVAPVLRNAVYLIENALEKVYEFRVLVVPGFVGEAVKIAEFLGELSVEAPLCFLAFRPNFVLDDARGITLEELESVVKVAEDYGLRADWAGLPHIPGTRGELKEFEELAMRKGCRKLGVGEGRLCTCRECALMGYKPWRRT